MVQQNIIWPLQPILPFIALDSTITATNAFMMALIKSNSKPQQQQQN